MKKILCFIGLVIQLSTSAQVRFEVKYSKSFSVYTFIQNLSEKSGPNPFKKLFTESEFNNKKYQTLLTEFDSIYTGYEHPFRDYPAFTKLGAETGSILIQNLLSTQSLEEFKQRSVGLIPFSDLNEIAFIIRHFEPVYEVLIYEPNKIIFEKQVKDIDSLLANKNIAGYFEQVKLFYNAAWDNSIPFTFAFYPLPVSKGFTAMTFNNFAVSAIPTSLTDYNHLLSVLLHELSHFLYDSQPLSFKKEIDSWFMSNSSNYSRYAYNLLNESWATAIGNGYFAEKLSGKLNPGNWYNSKYISRMGKLMYPAIKEYLDKRKPIDKQLIDHYIKIYEDSIPNSINELSYILNGRYGISDNPSYLDTLDQIYPPRFVSEYYNNFSSESFEKLKQIPLTKVIIISSNNKQKLKLIKMNFPELKNWHPHPQKDFIDMQLVADKTQLVVINLTRVSLESLLKATLTK